jgi:hypothetical protein
VKRLGRALEGWEQMALAAIQFWSGCSIFGCGTYASGWERHTYALLTEKWGAHSKSLRSSRRGQIFQVWRKFAARTCHKAYWKKLERIICSQQACLFALVSRPASIPWAPGIPWRHEYQYWKLLQQNFPRADKFCARRLWCEAVVDTIWCQWMLVKQSGLRFVCPWFVFFDHHLFIFFDHADTKKTHRDSKSFDLFWFFYFDGCTCMNKTCIDQTCIVWTQSFVRKCCFYQCLQFLLLCNSNEFSHFHILLSFCIGCLYNLLFQRLQQKHILVSGSN